MSSELNQEKTPAPPGGMIPVKPHKIYANRGNHEALSYLPLSAKRILDVGCGAGDNARLLADRGCQVTGVTFSEEEASLANRYCERVVVADVERDDLGLPEAGFDAILLSHILEHLREPHELLKRLARLIPIGGTMVIAVPNMAQWRMRWQFAMGDWRRTDTGPLDRTHLRFWSLKTAPEILNSTPFILTKVVAADLKLPLWPLRRLAPTLSARIDSTVGRWAQNAAAHQVLLVALRAS